MLVEDCFRGLEYTPLADWDRPGTSEYRLVLGLVIDKVSGLGSAPTSSEGSCARCG
ncbi:hypothetical protein AB0G29_15480 [Streptomyces parvus]|uniref:hypothetical protein n=1 Tax=Streptomyces parvus TaxID=66428 RepID=UPI0034032E62